MVKEDDIDAGVVAGVCVASVADGELAPNGATDSRGRDANEEADANVVW
jgi:hypothetical protein